MTNNEVILAYIAGFLDGDGIIMINKAYDKKTQKYEFYNNGEEMCACINISPSLFTHKKAFC